MTRIGRRWLPATSVGVGLTAALVLGVISPASADVVTPTAAPQEQPAEAPAEAVTVAGSPIEARLAALTQGTRVEVLSERTEYSQTFAEPDGTFTSESSTGIERVRDAESEDGWRTVDLTLQEGADGVIRPASPVYGLEIHPGGAEQDAPLVELTDGDNSIGFAWEGDELPEPELDGKRATYGDVEPGVDLVVEATRYGFEHYLVLTEKPVDPEDVQVVLPIVGDGLSLQQEGTSVAVVDSEGDTVGAVGQAFVWDANSDPFSATTETEANDLPVADVMVEEDGGQQTLVVTPDPEYLEEATYPVTIDPSVTYGSQSDTTVGSAYPGVSFASDTLLRFGTYTAGSDKWRSYLRFAGQKISGTQIVSATLQLYGNQSYNCTTYPFTAYPASPTLANSEITWNNQPTINSSEAVSISVGSKGGGTSCPAGWMTAANVQSIVQYFADTDRNTFSIGLRASETSSTGWKKVESDNGAHPPKLVVNYNRYPATPPAPTIANVVTSGSDKFVGTLTPTFSSKTTDADGNALTYKFQIYDANSTAAANLVYTCTTTGVASGVTGKCTIPSASKLSDNKSYWVRAGAKDSIMPASKWSALVALKTAAGKPPTPTISCPAQYSNGSWHDDPPASNVNCHVSVLGTGGNSAARSIAYRVDGATADIVKTVTPGAGGTFLVPVSELGGGHKITAYSKQIAGVTSATATYSFGYGSAALDGRVDGLKTNNVVRLSATAPPLGTATGVTAKLEWRAADREATGWNDIVGSIPTTGGTSTPVKVTNFLWETQDATTDNSSGPTVTLSSRLPVLLEVRICFTYTGGGTHCTDEGGDIATVLRVPHAYGDNFPVAEAGPGQVALWTGEFNISETDATAGMLSVSRSHSTFDGAQVGGYGVFGPGWTASFAGSEAGVAGYVVADSTKIDGTISLIDEAGDPLTYRQPDGKTLDAPEGTYIPVGEDTVFSEATLTVAGTGASRTLTLTEIDGTATTWKIAATGDARFRWVADNVVTPGHPGDTVWTTDSSGRTTRILESVSDAIACGVVLVKGCRALHINYATQTSGADVEGQVKEISYEAWDPASDSMLTTVIAKYSYTSGGRLASVTDPRTGMGTSYEYAASGTDSTRLTGLISSGQAGYGFEYSSGADLRLQKVTREGWAPGKPVTTLTTFVYGVSVAPAPASGLPDIGVASVSRWQQDRQPVIGFAAFGPDRPLASTDPANLTADDWRRASIQYTDDEGYVVNTATYGADAWRISATDFDELGNVIRAYDSMGIDDVVARYESDPDVWFDASEYATVTRYNAGSVVDDADIPSGLYVTDEWGPAADSIMSDGVIRRVRVHTHFDYDEGAPVDEEVDGRWGLVTTTTVGATVVEEQPVSSDPGSPIPEDIEVISVVHNGYDPIDGAPVTGGTSGWTLGGPTTRRLEMGGSPSDDLTVAVRYNDAGQVVEQRTALSQGGDEGATLSVYYSADGSAGHEECRNRPEWAGLICWTGAAADPASGGSLPDTRITGYTYYLSVSKSVEVSGQGTSAVSRVTSMEYDTSDRILTSDTVVNGSVSASPLPKKRWVYDPVSGQVLKSQTLSPEGEVVSEEATAYDLWGRVISTTSELGQSATTTYVEPGQPGAGQTKSVSDPKGTSTYEYGGLDANGQVEYRGLPTTLSVSGVGEYRAAYDEYGAIAVQAAPGGIIQKYVRNEIGQLIGKSYEGQVTQTDPETGINTTTTGAWFAWSREYDFQGRVLRDYAPSSTLVDTSGPTRSYGYDRAGRLVHVTDRSTGECITRDYTFDKQGNRTGLTTTLPGADGSCGAGSDTSDTWAYDLSSRALTGRDGQSAYEHDAFGRVTTLPAADAPIPTDGDIALGYFEDDQVRSIGQDGVTTTFDLDISGRRLVETTSGAGVETTELTRYYIDGSDSPSWIEETNSEGTNTTRYTTAIGSGLSAIVNDAGAVKLTVDDLHGDLVTTIPLPTTGNAIAIDGWSVTDEYGNQSATVDSAPVDTGAAQYGWLGTHQRATLDTGLILMGARLYNPATGRFTSVDPVVGGNENAYNYPNNPILLVDLNGRWVIPAAILAVLLAGAEAFVTAAILTLVIVGVAWLISTGIQLLIDQIKASAAVKAKLARIPKPGGKSYKPKETYVIYRISRISTNETYKYGITAQKNWHKRPKSQLSLCKAKMGGTCQYNSMGTKTGYYNARVLEYLLILTYAMKHDGNCPPGQFYSCK